VSSSLCFLFRRLPIFLLLTIDVPMAGCPAFTPRFAGFVYGPFVRMTLLVSSLSAFARDASLFLWIHRCESASSFLHNASSGTPVGFVMQEQRQIAADIAGDQKVLSHVLMSLFPELLSERGV
jgi:hypothetical protein